MIRADGEKLYAQSGALPGEALPQMLLATLRQSGRTFTDAEAALLEKAVTEASSALTQENHAAAGKALGPLAKLGTLGELKSYSRLAQQADSLAQKVREKAEQSIAQAKEQLADPSSASEGVLRLVEAESAYDSFADLKAQVTTELRRVRNDEALEAAVRQAESLQRARRYAEAENASVRRQATDAYALVIQRYPESLAARLAREELRTLDPDADVLQTSDTPSEVPFRTWTDRTGQFEIAARYVQQKQGYVQLQKRDGTLIAVPINKLSDADQAYLRDR